MIFYNQKIEEARGIPSPHFATIGVYFFIFWGRRARNYDRISFFFVDEFCDSIILELE